MQQVFVYIWPHGSREDVNIRHRMQMPLSTKTILIDTILMMTIFYQIPRKLKVTNISLKLAYSKTLASLVFEQTSTWNDILLKTDIKYAYWSHLLVHWALLKSIFLKFSADQYFLSHHHQLFFNIQYLEIKALFFLLASFSNILICIIHIFKSTPYFRLFLHISTPFKD